MENEKYLDQEKWTLNVDFEQSIKIFLCSIRQCSLLGQYSRVQNQNIDPPPAFYSLLNEVFALAQVAHVGLDCNSAVGADRLYDFVGRVRRGEVVDDDISTSSTEGKGGRFPDTLGGASHECDLACECERRLGRHCDQVEVIDEEFSFFLGLHSTTSTVCTYHLTKRMTSTRYGPPKTTGRKSRWSSKPEPSEWLA